MAKRVVACRWLRADARARPTRFSPWATLTVILPIAGVGLSLLLRPHGRLRECLLCQSTSLGTGSQCLHWKGAWPAPGAGGEASVVWRLPGSAAVPLAAIVALAITSLFLQVAGPLRGLVFVLRLGSAAVCREARRKP